MKTPDKNPFLYGRREYEDLKGIDIYIPNTESSFDFFKWISGQQFLFEGIRGSGKTSILKSMHWSLIWKKEPKDRIKGNLEIDEYFSGKDLPRHLGVIFKCDELDNEVWNDWAEKFGSKKAQRIFAVYIEYSFLYLLLDSLSNIINEKPDIFSEDWTQEEAITNIVLSLAFPDKTFRPLLRKSSFFDLSIIFKEKSGIIRSQICKEVPYEDIISTINLDDAGKIIQGLGESLVKNPKLNNLLIFPMVDDCDRLKPWQSSVIGNFIYRARNPISFKATTVLNLNNIKFTTNKRPITEHELKRIAISGTTETDWETNSSFYHQFNGILQSRINRTFGEEYAQLFSLSQLLGKPNLDELVIKVINSSHGEEAIKFYEEFKSQSAEKSIINFFMKTWGIVDIPDYDPEKESSLERKLRIRKKYTFSNKRRQVSAIAMFKTKELKELPYPYAGTDVVLKLCCGSVRELLRIMYEIWNEAKMPIETFVKLEQIPFEIQNRAIRKASRSYWDSIITSEAILNTEWDKKSSCAPPTSPALFCNRIGQLFSFFQSFPYICKSNEIGSLKVNIYSQDIEHVIDYLTMAGIIIQNNKNDKKTIIALHPFFAPIFGLSPRHPFYYSKAISNEDFEIILRGSDQDFHNKILLGDKNQLSMKL